MIEGYLLERENLAMVFVLVDGEIGPTKLDIQMLDWLRYNTIPHTVVATKMDKVKSAKRATPPQGPRRRLLARSRRHRVGERQQGRRHRHPAIARAHLDRHGALKSRRRGRCPRADRDATRLVSVGDMSSPSAAATSPSVSITGTGLWAPPEVGHERGTRRVAHRVGDPLQRRALGRDRSRDALAARALPDEEFIVKASGHQVATRGRQGGRARPRPDAPAPRAARRGPARAPGRDGDAGDPRGARPGRPDRRRRRRGDRRLLEPAARLSGRGDRDPERARRRGLGLRHERRLPFGHVLDPGRGRCAAQRLGRLRAWSSTPRSPPGHNNFELRDFHFIFGDACTALVLERSDDAVAADRWEILGTKLATQFSNNIRNDFGFLNIARGRRARPARVDLPPERAAWCSARCARWSPRTSPPTSTRLGFDRRRRPSLLAPPGQPEDEPADRQGRARSRCRPTTKHRSVLDEYANTSSAGSIIAFHEHRDDLVDGDVGVICSFGAGYSVGSVIVRRT